MDLCSSPPIHSYCQKKESSCAWPAPHHLLIPHISISLGPHSPVLLSLSSIANFFLFVLLFILKRRRFLKSLTTLPGSWVLCMFFPVQTTHLEEKPLEPCSCSYSLLSLVSDLLLPVSLAHDLIEFCQRPVRDCILRNQVMLAVLFPEFSVLLNAMFTFSFLKLSAPSFLLLWFYFFFPQLFSYLLDVFYGQVSSFPSLFAL